MSGPNPSLTFKIFKGDQLLREESLSQAVIKIGKLSSSHLRLEDESVSRMHAVIEVSSDEISIIDLGSTKGTMVNGQKINKAVLQQGDVIVLGDIRLELSIAAAAAEAAVPAAPVAAAPSAPIAAAPIAAPPVAAPAAAPAAAYAAPVAAAPMAAGALPAFGSDAGDDMGGARSIEVAALLGDSVIGVKHVMNPKGGKVSATTYGLFGFGAILLVISSIAFFSGVSTAADNKHRKEEHLAAKKIAHEFRPRRLSPAFDFMALGGLFGGMICMTMGLVRIREEKVDPRFRIGRASGVDFPTENSPVEDFNLVAPQGDGFVFNFSQGWEGEMNIDGQVTPLADLIGLGRARQSASMTGAIEVPLPPKTRIRVSTGNQSFMVSSVPQPRRQGAAAFAMDSELMAYIAASAILILGFVWILDNLRPDPKTMMSDMFASSDRASRTQTKPNEDPLEEEEEELEDDGEDPGGTGERQKDEEGKMGKKESNRATGQFAMKNNNADPQLARQQATDQARQSGVLGVFAQTPGGAFASLTGAADFSSGLDDSDVYGGLLGNEVGEMAGGYGYGITGMGPGGGGTGWGTVGTGGYGTIGHGNGTGSGYGTGSGKGGMRGRKASPPKVKIGNASATGDLDKAIIRRYIRRKLSRIRFCYESQLVVKPKLSGTVKVQFLISPSGQVQGAKASGIGDGKVESCVAAAIKSIKFPKPNGGGMVNVTYPFTFAPAGG